MLQDLLLLAAAAPAATGGTASNAEALQQMGFSHMVQNFDAVGLSVFVILVIMSIGSWWYTVVNIIKNMVIKSRADRVVRTFWETANPQDAIRYM
jgi:biopolymer transport protein ExbB